MRITKELKYVDGVGFQRIINYKINIEKRKSDTEGTTRAFLDIKEQILNGELIKARNGLERVFYEKIPNDFEEKMKHIEKNKVSELVDKWLGDYLEKGEIGFYMLVYQNIK